MILNLFLLKRRFGRKIASLPPLGFLSWNFLFNGLLKIVTARRTIQIIWQEKWEKLKFWKINLKSSRNILTKLYVLSWSFFPRPLENLLWILRACWKDLKCTPNVHLCVRKRSWPHDALIRKYWWKCEKNAFLQFFYQKSEGGNYYIPATIAHPEVVIFFSHQN